MVVVVDDFDLEERWKV
jgi:hypothetical protein